MSSEQEIIKNRRIEDLKKKIQEFKQMQEISEKSLKKLTRSD